MIAGGYFLPDFFRIDYVAAAEKTDSMSTGINRVRGLSRPISRVLVVLGNCSLENGGYLRKYSNIIDTKTNVTKIFC